LEAGVDVTEILCLVTDLDSTDPEVKLRAIDNFGEAVQSLVDQVVNHLADPEPWRYLVLERLPRFGTLTLAPLERLLRESTDQDVRLVAAIGLLGLGSNTPVSIVLDAVRTDEPYLCMAVRVLARQRISAAIPLIEQVLRTYDISQQTQPTISCLLDALQLLGADVSDDFRQRLCSVKPDWLRLGLLRDVETAHTAH
jgi:HEAT repeat protein